MSTFSCIRQNRTYTEFSKKATVRFGWISLKSDIEPEYPFMSRCGLTKTELFWMCVLNHEYLKAIYAMSKTNLPRNWLSCWKLFTQNWINYLVSQNWASQIDKFRFLCFRQSEAKGKLCKVHPHLKSFKFC